MSENNELAINNMANNIIDQYMAIEDIVGRADAIDIFDKAIAKARAELNIPFRDYE